MEIFVEVFAREVMSVKKHAIGNAFFIFVALDGNGKVTPVISLRPTTISEKKFYDAALRRKKEILNKDNEKSTC